MVFPFPRTALTLAAIGWFLAGSPVAAFSPPIKDAAGFFTPDAVRQATEEIEEIERFYDKKVVIETVSSPSTLKKWSLQFKSPESRSRFYQDWAVKEARKIGPNCVFVLICKEPLPIHIAVASGREADKKAIPAKERDTLQNRLQARFEQKEFDEGLLDGVRFIRQTLETHKDDRPLASTSNPWSGVLTTIFVMAGLWLCLEFILRFQLNKNADAVSFPAIDFGNGGSYLSGLFAAMNRNWIQDLWQAFPSGKKIAADSQPSTSLESAQEPENQPISDDDWKSW